MAAIARRAAADVDCDVEGRTGGDPHQLGLAGWRTLEMQPTHDAAVDRERVVFLNKRDIDAVLSQHILAKNLRKKAARVAMAHRPDLLYVGDLGRNDLHAVRVLDAGKLRAPLCRRADRSYGQACCD